MLIVDTREKKNQLIINYLERNKIPYKKQKLDVGDYAIEGDNSIVVDRKQNLDEIAQNIICSDKRRFYREIRRARANGQKVIILCEHGGRIKSINDVYKWNSKYTQISGKALADCIFECHIAYGIEFLFCDKRSTGRRICEILGILDE